MQNLSSAIRQILWSYKKLNYLNIFNTEYQITQSLEETARTTIPHRGMLLYVYTVVYHMSQLNLILLYRQ